MRISIIIPTRNEAKNLPRLFASLAKQSFTDFEIILVDNFSADDTLKIASKFTDKFFQKGPERTAQRNFGIGKAAGGYILFLDADMELQPDVLNQCYQLIESNKNMAGVLIDELSVGNSFLTKIKALEKEIYSGRAEIEAARFFRKKDLIKIGGYDENLISGEDWDLSQRMKKLGSFAKISAKIYHHETDSLISDVKKKYYYALYIKKYASKHPNYFAKQAGFLNRFLILFAKPQLILKHPAEFVGLIFLKLVQFLAYLVASPNKISYK